MKSFKNVLGLSLISLVVAACGGDDSQAPDTLERLSPNVNVNEIPYSLQEVIVEARIRYQDGTEQEFRNSFRNPEMLAQEAIFRKTVGDRFVLEINEEIVPINVGGDGRFGYDVNLRKKDGCERIGTAVASGEAVFERLNLDYELNLRLIGEDCPPSMISEFSEIQNAELNGLNLQILHGIQEAGLWSEGDVQDIFVRIIIQGVQSRL